MKGITLSVMFFLKHQTLIPRTKLLWQIMQAFGSIFTSWSSMCRGTVSDSVSDAYTKTFPGTNTVLFLLFKFPEESIIFTVFFLATGVLIYVDSAQKRKSIFPAATVVTAVTHSLIASSISVCLSALKHLRCKILPYFNRH